MNYKNNYITNLKNYSGEIVPEYIPTKYIQDCYDIITFINKIGICWYLSILIIFIFGDTTSPFVQNILVNFNLENKINRSENYLKLLLKDKYNKHDLLELILVIKDIFKIKYTKINKIKTKQKVKLLKSNDNAEMIVDIYNKIFNYTNKNGGDFFDTVFFTNILSSILLNKLTKTTIIYINNKFNINNKIDIELVNNSLGIIITSSVKNTLIGHDCCFFKCNNKLMYSSNHLSFEYNWIELFLQYNKLIDANIKFNIYINLLYDVGPIIITETNELFIYKKSRKSKKIKMQNKIQNQQQGLNPLFIYDIVKFTILNFYTKENINNFSVDNNLEYLFYYIENNNNYNIQVIKDLLNIDNYDYNLSYNGISPFKLACYKNNIIMVKLFLESSKAIDYNCISNGITLFYRACHYNNIEIIKLFLNADKDIYYNFTNNGVSPFYLICNNNNIELVKLFLSVKNKINYNLLYDGESPFYCACSNNNIDIVSLLLLSNKKIDYNLPYNDITPFYVVCELEYYEIIKLLLSTNKQINYNSLCDDGKTAFYMACEQEKFEIVNLLLSTNKTINYDLPYKGKTAFYMACELGKYKIIKLILMYNRSDINYNFLYNNISPLEIAYQNKHINIVNLLKFNILI
uniref:Uncharacterized protein n=1 Tax=viral metagenome TaxID=1070528 RepID=A0A6C0EFM5_9ZZZZ